MDTLTRRQAIRLIGAGAGIALGQGAGAGPLLAQTRTPLAIGTASKAGVFYPFGSGMAALISKYIPGIEATAEVTGGSKDNMRLLHAGTIQLALVEPEIARDASRGLLKEVPEKVAVRTLLATYSGRLHIVTLEGSGIRTVVDLRGKRVSMGPAAGGSEGIGLLVFEAYGIMPQDLASLPRLGYAESAAALKEGKLDAFLFSGGVPGPAVRELAATPGVKIRLIPNGDAASRLAAKDPMYFAGRIPGRTYAGVDEDVSAVARASLFVTHERLEERLAYEITKLILERTDELVAAHAAAREISLTSAVRGSPLPFHPGAMRYYKEKGITPP